MCSLPNTETFCTSCHLEIRYVQRKLPFLPKYSTYPPNLACYWIHYMRICYMRGLSGTYLSHITRSTCTDNETLMYINLIPFLTMLFRQDFSFVTTGSSLGTLLTGTVGSYVNETFGWPYVFYTIGKTLMTSQNN